jgi:hypothetical protein
MTHWTRSSAASLLPLLAMAITGSNTPVHKGPASRHSCTLIPAHCLECCGALLLLLLLLLWWLGLLFACQ